MNINLRVVIICINFEYRLLFLLYLLNIYTLYSNSIIQLILKMNEYDGNGNVIDETRTNNVSGNGHMNNNDRDRSRSRSNERNGRNDHGNDRGGGSNGVNTNENNDNESNNQPEVGSVYVTNLSPKVYNICNICTIYSNVDIMWLDSY